MWSFVLSVWQPVEMFGRLVTSRARSQVGVKIEEFPSFHLRTKGKCGLLPGWQSFLNFSEQDKWDKNKCSKLDFPFLGVKTQASSLNQKSFSENLGIFVSFICAQRKMLMLSKPFQTYLLLTWAAVWPWTPCKLTPTNSTLRAGQVSQLWVKKNFLKHFHNFLSFPKYTV